MLENFSRLRNAGKFTAKCELSNQNNVQINFSNLISSHNLNNVDLFVNADFFGGNGSYRIKNAKPVLISIALGIPVDIQFQDMDFSIKIIPKVVTITQEEPNIAKPNPFFDKDNVYQWLKGQLADAEKNVSRIKELIDYWEDTLKKD